MSEHLDRLAREIDDKRWGRFSCAFINEYGCKVMSTVRSAGRQRYTKEQVIQRRKELINKPTEWPKWAKFLAQDGGGDWYFYSCKPMLTKDIWIPPDPIGGRAVLHQHGEALDDWTQSLQERPAANDADAGMRYPADFEHKNNGQPVVDAAPEWDGNGLPPIGCKVEYVENDELIAGEFVQFWSGGDTLEVLCHAPNGDGKIAVVHNPRFVGATSLVNGCMRPIDKRTEKQKDVDEMLAVTTANDLVTCEELYDAGYRRADND